MIDYATLCQALDDWKHGRRPSTAPYPVVSAEAALDATETGAEEAPMDYEVDLAEVEPTDGEVAQDEPADGSESGARLAAFAQGEEDAATHEPLASADPDDHDEDPGESGETRW